MSLKNIFQNISKKITNNNSEGAAIRLKIVIGIVFLAFVCFLVWGLYRHRNIQTTGNQDAPEVSKEENVHSEENDVESISQKELEKEYRSAIENYNELAGNYNTMIEGLSERNILVDGTTVEMKEIEEDTFPKDKETINGLVKQIVIESGALSDEYMTKCVEGYNSVMFMYNEQISRYNQAVEKISSYQLTEKNDTKVEKQELKEYSAKWDNAEEYLIDVDNLQQDISVVNTEFYKMIVNTGNELVDDYNLVAEEYNTAVGNAVITYVSGIPGKVTLKKELKIADFADKSDDKIFEFLDEYNDDNKQLVGNYIVVTQITAPQESWIEDRLRSISDLTGMEAVTKANDPNGLLGKDGGYTSCVYFTVKGIDPKDIPGESIVDMGTDAGGAVEIYDTRENALNRCDYLSQFDGTVLYTGSYTVVGTIVIRISYKLNDEQQGRLVDSIISKLTEIQ